MANKDEKISGQELAFIKDNKYASKGGQDCLRGFIYQLKLLMLFMIRGLRKGYKFRLATEMMAAEDFDDLIFEYESDGDTTCCSKIAYRFLQAKHTQNDAKEIDAENLFTSSDFNLQKYFNSYCNIKRHSVLSRGILDDFIIYTNINLNEEKLKAKGIRLLPVKGLDEFLDVKTRRNDDRRYKFDSEEPSKIYENLASEAYNLAQMLVEKVLNSKKLSVDTDLLKKYRTALTAEVISIKDRTLSENFIDGSENLSERGKYFREVFYAQVLKQKGLPNDYDRPEDLWKEMKDQSLKLSEGFISDYEIEDSEKLSMEFKTLLKDAKVDEVIKVELNKKSASKQGGRVVIAHNIARNIVTLDKYVLIEKTDDLFQFNPNFLDDSIKQPADIFKLKKSLKSKLGSQYGDLDKYQFEMKSFTRVKEEQLRAKCELPEGKIDDKEIAGFLDKLIFAVKQPNEVELGEILTREMSEDDTFNLLDADLVTHRFEQKMREWFLDRKGTFMSMEEGRDLISSIREKVNTLMISGISLAYPEELEEYGIEFDNVNEELVKFLSSDAARDPNLALSLITKGETLPAAIQVHKAVKQCNKYRKQDSVIFIRQETLIRLKIRERVIDAFKSLGSYELLVIVCKSSDELVMHKLSKFYQKLSTIMQKNNTKKLILVTGTEVLLNNCSKNIDCNVGFNDFTINSQQELLNKQVINLQGRKERSSFGNLLRISRLDEIESVKKAQLQDTLLKSSTLVKLIGGEEIKIGNELKGLGEVDDYYITRSVNLQVIIRTDIFRSDQTSDLFAIGHADNKSWQKFQIRGVGIESSDEIEPWNRYSHKFKVLNDGQENEQFERLCTEYPKHDVHWLMMGSSGLLWVKSRGNITTLVKHRDGSGDYYCSYDHCQVCNAATRVSSVDQLANQHERPVIISNTAGMGKTIMFTYLARKLADYPGMWVIKINLNDFTEVLLEELRSRTFHENDIVEAIEFFVDKLLVPETDLEKEIFKRLIQEPGGVGLLLDGFDEISPDYEEVVTDLLKAFKKCDLKTMFIATRPHMRITLENTLQIFSCSIEPFSQNDQVDFLVRFWVKDFGKCDNREEVLNWLDDRAKDLIAKLAKTISDPLMEFTRIPLHIRMVAEVFCYDKQCDSEVCEVSLTLDNDEWQFPERINMITLYKRFVERKYGILCNEKDKEDHSRLGSKKRSEKFFETVLESHQLLAMKTLLNGKDLSMLRVSRRDIKKAEDLIIDINDGNERTGIVTQIVDGKPQYIHRTIMEYFVATYLINVLKYAEEDKDCPNRKLRTFILKQILTQPEYDIIRAFFNDLLNEVHATYDVCHWKAEPDDYSNENRRTLFHIAAMEGNHQIMRFFLVRLGKNTRTRQQIANMKSNFGEVALHLIFADRWDGLRCRRSDANDLQIIKWLLENGADVNAVDMVSRTPMRRALIAGKVDALKLMAKNQIIDVEARDKSATTFEQGLAETREWQLVTSLLNELGAGTNKLDDLGRLDILRWLVKNHIADINVRDTSGKTLQHVAAARKNFTVLKWLVVERGADLHARDDFGNTVLHTAVARWSLADIKWLVEELGADLDTRDNDGSTIQHSAAASGRWEILRWLVEEKGADVNVRDDMGRTLQHNAVLVNLSMLKWLVEKHGANTNVRDHSGNTLQHEAVTLRNLSTLKWLVEERGADVYAHDATGRTIQHVAVQRQELEVLNYLVEERGADPNVWDNSGRTLQHYAAKFGELEILKWLVENHGVDIEARDHLGKTVQHEAAEHGQSDELEWLVEKQNVDVNAQDYSGMTLMHWAAQNRNWDVVKWLIEEQNADVHVADESGRTLLYWAAQRENWELVKWLVEERGADINAWHDSGRTLQHKAASYYNLDVLKWLVEESGADVDVWDDSGRTLQHEAAEAGKLNILKWLIEERGVDINARDNSGSTLQHKAAAFFALDVLKWLIEERGADINVRDYSGRTLQDVATKAGRLNVVKWLVEKQGVDVEARNSFGRTLHHEAAYHHHWKIVKWLAEKHRADVNIRDDSGRTLQHEAACYWHLYAMKWLLRDRGSDINARDYLGRTVQHAAAEAGEFTILRWLVNNEGVDINARDYSGKTLQHEAAKAGKLNILRWLVSQKGVDVNACDDLGRTLQHDAAAAGELEVLRWLVKSQGVYIDAQDKSGNTLRQEAVMSGKLEVLKWLDEQQDCR
ncbi:uncharacterized protein LOC124177987 [Neodiprion fabricii]|uniref:uncharacterized protein LOC124177987 n=1 Tax=Neodiprion fabricii TaxID=2872261 RepID=UPI001ED8E41D|nr:uncharacterized protein LOC124177987 [Neodiprion fabricii]